jgi:hypothetical protein
MTAAVNKSQIYTSIINHSHTQRLLYNRIGLGDYSVPDMGHRQVIAPGRENTQKLYVLYNGRGLDSSPLYSYINNTLYMYVHLQSVFNVHTRGS